MPTLKDIKEKFRTGSFSELARGSFRSFLLRIGGTLLSYVFTVTVTRLFGDDGYGAFMLAQTFMMVSVMIGRLGMDTVLLRWVSSLRAKGKEGSIPTVFKQGLRLVLPLSVGLSLLFWILAPWIAPLLFDDPLGSSYLRWMILGVLPMALLYLTSEALRGLKEVEWAMLLRTILPFGIGALIVLLVQGTGNALDPIRAFLVGILVAAVLGLIIWSRRMGWKGAKELPEDHGMERMIRTGLPLLLSSSMFLIMNDLDLLMLGYFVKEADVGVYSAAMRIANLCNVALFAVNMIAAPKFSEKYAQEDLKGLDQVVRRATQMVFSMVFPIVLVLFLFPGTILSLFGAEFQEGRMTLYLLATGKFINAASGSVMYLLQMTEREKVGMRILIAAAIANVAMNLFFIPQWGIEGAALASMLAIGGWNIYGGIYIWRHDRILTFFWPFRQKKVHG